MAWVFAIIGGVLGLVVTANSSQLLGPVIGVVSGLAGAACTVGLSLAICVIAHDAMDFGGNMSRCF